jgi:hypothetical protein
MRLDGYIRVSRIGGREGEGYISPRRSARGDHGLTRTSSPTPTAASLS